jgi:Flp pilus assembly protein TadD
MVFVLRRKQPYLLVGWCWYLGMLVPVIGLVQVGGQARADRYTYLPQIGLYLMISWGLPVLLADWRYRRQIMTALAGVVLAALIWQSGVQASYWRHRESLWRHTLAVTSATEVAQNALGQELLRQGRRDEAIEHFQTALRIRPGFLDAESNLGIMLLQEGKVDDAIIHFRRVLASNPQLAKGHFDMGSALLQKEEPNEASGEFQKAVELKPDYAEAHNNLAITLFQSGRADEAINHWQRSLALAPGNAETHNNLAVALLQKGQIREAISHWQKALQFQSDRMAAQLSLAWVLATCPDASLRDGAKALVLAQHAQQLSDNRNPMVFRVLAAAEAETGRLPQAVAAAEQGLRVASAAGNARLAELLQTEVDLYRSGIPFRDSSLTAQPSQ